MGAATAATAAAAATAPAATAAAAPQQQFVGGPNAAGTEYKFTSEKVTTLQALIDWSSRGRSARHALFVGAVSATMTTAQRVRQQEILRQEHVSVLTTAQRGHLQTLTQQSVSVLTPVQQERQQGEGSDSDGNVPMGQHLLRAQQKTRLAQDGTGAAAAVAGDGGGRDGRKRSAASGGDDFAVIAKKKKYGFSGESKLGRATGVKKGFYLGSD